MRIEENLLTINPYSRPGILLDNVKKIVMHYVETPGQTPDEVRDWFELRKNGENSYGSAHYIIGMEGEILRVIPEQEVSYNCGSSRGYTEYARHVFGVRATSADYSPNHDTLAIEMCNVDDSGFFTSATLESAVKLCVDLCRRYGLNESDITTHHNVVGWKPCPKYWVDNPEEFQLFTQKVREKL